VTLATPEQSIAFWWRTLVDSVRAGGQLIFETLLPPSGQGTDIQVAIRSNFQLGGDVVMSIDERILQRPDGQDILEVHTKWTGWCLTQLGQALGLPIGVRYLGWTCLLTGPFCFIGGIFQAGNLLQPLGILLSMPGHMLLPPEIRRYFSWLPVGLAAIIGLLSGVGLAGVELQTGHIAMLALFQGGVWQSVGGRCVTRLGKHVSHYLIRRAMKHVLA
jgi:hypothetical protein